MASCSTKYLVSDKFLAPDKTIVRALFGLTELIKSIFDPVFKNYGEHPAKGPNNNVSFPSITRESKCGTDIGGAPTAALPYTLAWWSFTISELSQAKNTPLTGKPPNCLLSGIPVFCKSGNAPPPAPINTCFAV